MSSMLTMSDNTNHGAFKDTKWPEALQVKLQDIRQRMLSHNYVWSPELSPRRCHIKRQKEKDRESEAVR